MAKLLNTNTTYVSSIINKRYKMTFISLLNKYRIDMAREKLSSSQYKNYSMEGIANEVGFQSRSSFYTHFKNETGLSPAVYARNCTEIYDDQLILNPEPQVL